MSNLDRAFIKAYDKSTNETSQSQRRASTRDVLLSISLRKQDGQTKRIEQPVESPQSQLGGPHMTFPVSMATGQHDVSMPDADLASSSVIVVPMAEIEPTTVTEKEPERPPRRDEENAVPSSRQRQNINLDEIRRVRELEEQRAQRAKAKREAEAAAEVMTPQPFTTYVDSVQRADWYDQPQSPIAQTPAAESPAAQQPASQVGAAPSEASAKLRDGHVSDEAAWEPAWELDRIEWPAMTDQMLSTQIDYFAEAGDQLRDSTADGLNVLAISSESRSEGRTTLAICLARSAVAAGVRVAVIDADIDNPSLAGQLNLSEIPGWNEVLDGRTPLPEAAVASIEDRVCIFPLSRTESSESLTLSNSAVSSLIRRVAQEFELVIVDAGPLGDERTGMFEGGERCPVDAAVIVRDVRVTEPTVLSHNIRLWRAIGVNAVGVVENFVVDS